LFKDKWDSKYSYIYKIWKYGKIVGIL
jgi:hypothetical protein